jgi:hypothetical protein
VLALPVALVLLADPSLTLRTSLEQRVGFAAPARPPPLQVGTQGAAPNQPQAIIFADVFDGDNGAHIQSDAPHAVSILKHTEAGRVVEVKGCRRVEGFMAENTPPQSSH